MYFASRYQAGRMLAKKLVTKYRYENCAVVALTDGGVIVGAQIAKELHCVLNMLLTEEIVLPREPVAIGGITSDGKFVYNPTYNSSEIDEIVSESRTEIEQQKLLRIHDMNRLLGKGGLISRKLLYGHNVILVADGLKDDFILQLAYEFLKPIKIAKLIVATPLASVRAVDWVHVYADDVYCLSVVEEYFETDHYYDKQDVPSRGRIIKTIENITEQWQ